MVILEQRDLATVEFLNEETLSKELKDYLLREFGQDGERTKWMRHTEKEYEKCLKRYGRCLGCGGCGPDHPYLQQSLLGLITCAIADADAGRLDPLSGKYHEDDDLDYCF
jgi:hypothetical protein